MDCKKNGNNVDAPQEIKTVDEMPEIQDADMEAHEHDAGTLTMSKLEIPTRTYVISIVYSKFYKVPQFFFYGLNEAKEVLTFEEIREDVSPEHLDKTVTLEAFPHHRKKSQVSVHPCRQGQVVNTLLQTLSTTSLTQDPHEQVREAMFYFLKVLATILPTIECE